MRSIQIASFFLASSVIFSTNTFGADLQWSGRYRTEGIFLKNTTLDKNEGIEDSYLIHHLILEPKIIASDGLNIKARFDIFNNALGNDQRGQVFGNYTGPGGTPAGTTPQPSASLSHTQQSESVVATELYLNWVNEFGALVVGRVPFQFGLGMTFSAGNGAFDHAHSTKDLVAYKLSLGNLTIMPAYGKIRESVLTKEDDINDYIVTVDYNNPESDLSMGFLFNSRIAALDSSSPTAGNDFPANYFSNMNSSFGTASVYDGYSAYNMNFFVKKKSDNFNLAAELGFLSGYSGVQVLDTAGKLNRVELSGFGLATEFGYRTGNLNLDLRAGLASGDDPDTPVFEGYFFNSNYDLSMMMFNYTLGQYDALRSTLAGTRAAASSTSAATRALAGLDTEVVSNAIYFSPSLKLAVGERYDLLASFTYATTHRSSISSTQGSVGSSLGFETNLGLSYHPSDRFTWRTELGFFFPGSAWSGTTGSNFRTDFAYGATSKAAINF